MRYNWHRPPGARAVMDRQQAAQGRVRFGASIRWELDRAHRAGVRRRRDGLFAEAMKRAREIARTILARRREPAAAWRP